MKKNKYIIATLWALVGIWVIFIWSNSLKPGNSSGEMSGSVTEVINAVVGFFIPGFEFSHYFIRKMAHFSEFAILGGLLCISFRKTLPKKSYLVFLAVPSAFLVASADEVIQLFVDGRAGSFADVMIDTSGALTATALAFLVLVIKDKIKCKKTPVE